MSSRAWSSLAVFACVALVACNEGPEVLDTQTDLTSTLTLGDTVGDGDPGDGDPGDGDPTTGDGDPGDGDPGDGDPGDGDPTTGDGDPTGDGDGDPDPGVCPSNGAGGAVGQAAIAAAAYPNTPGVIHVPQSYDPNTATPLMLALHGSGDTAGNFVNLWSGLAESEGFIVLVPESLSGGISWNGGTDTQVIDALLTKVEAEWNIDTCRVYLTGYSAGAHYGYALGLGNADYFAALGVQAGSLGYAQQVGVWPNNIPRPLAVSIHHGVNDNIVPIMQAELARDLLMQAGHTVYYHTHQGGHEIGAGDPAQMWANISTHTVTD